jgi:tRNA G37 N-methylase TrmD
MVLMPEPLFSAVEAIKGESLIPVILPTLQGRLFTQKVATELATYS